MSDYPTMTWRDGTFTNANPGPATINVNKTHLLAPAVGDLLILSVSGGNTSPTNDTGWQGWTYESGSFPVGTWWKLCTGSEPSQFHVPVTYGGLCDVILAIYRETTGFDISGIQHFPSFGSQSTAGLWMENTGLYLDEPDTGPLNVPAGNNAFYMPTGNASIQYFLSTLPPVLTGNFIPSDPGVIPTDWTYDGAQRSGTTPVQVQTHSKVYTGSELLSATQINGLHIPNALGNTGWASWAVRYVTPLVIEESADVLSTVATIDHDLLIGVEEDQHHAKVHDLTGANHTGGFKVKTGAYPQITDADFTNETPVNGMVAMTYDTGSGQTLWWVRAGGTWDIVEVTS